MARSMLERRTASFAASLPVMNSFVLGASRNKYSGVTTFCRFASAWGSFLAPSSGLGAATLVMGSPCGFVFCSASSASLIMTPLSYIARAVRPYSAFTLHLLSGMAEGSRTGKARCRWSKGEGIGVSFPAVHSRLRTGKSYVLAILRQLNAHFFAYPLEDLRGLSQLNRVRIPNRQHRIFMPLLRTDRHRQTVRPCTNHFQGQVGVMTMHADEDAGFDLVAPNREVRMVRIDDLFRVDLRILRTIVRHGDDHDVRNLGSDLQHCLGLFNGMIVPGPEYQRSWEDRGVWAGQHFTGHLFDDLVFIGFQQTVVEPLPWVGQRDPHLSRRRRMKSGRTRNNDAFSCIWCRCHSCTSLITQQPLDWTGLQRWISLRT